MAPINPVQVMEANTFTDQLSPLQQVLERVKNIEILQHQLAGQVAALRPLLQLLGFATSTAPAHRPSPAGNDKLSTSHGQTEDAQGNTIGNATQGEDHASASSAETPRAPIAMARPQHQARQIPHAYRKPLPSPNGARYTTLNSIDDYGIRKKIQLLRELLPNFPHISILQYFDALARHQGNVEEAARWLSESENDEPPVPVKAPVRSKQSGLKRKFGATLEREGDDDDEIVVGGRTRCLVKFCLPKESLEEVVGGVRA